MELDLLHPFEPIEAIPSEPDPVRAGRLKDWLLYHQAFLLEQELGPTALLAVQPGRLEIAPYQLVPVRPVPPTIDTSEKRSVADHRALP